MSPKNQIRYCFFPRTEPPPHFADSLVDIFRNQITSIGTRHLDDGLKSNEVLTTLRSDLIELGFQVESGKSRKDKISRPVFFGQGGEPTLKYEVDAYHSGWRCGLEVEAGRAWKGNAIYRDLVQAMVMVQVDTLALAVPNVYKWKSGSSPDYDNTFSVAEALFSHDRVDLPYSLLLIGY